MMNKKAYTPPRTKREFDRQGREYAARQRAEAKVRALHPLASQLTAFNDNGSGISRPLPESIAGAETAKLLSNYFNSRKYHVDKATAPYKKQQLSTEALDAIKRAPTELVKSLLNGVKGIAAVAWTHRPPWLDLGSDLARRLSSDGNKSFSGAFKQPVLDSGHLFDQFLSVANGNYGPLVRLGAAAPALATSMWKSRGALGKGNYWRTVNAQFGKDYDKLVTPYDKAWADLNRRIAVDGPKTSYWKYKNWTGGENPVSAAADFWSVYFDAPSLMVNALTLGGGTAVRGVLGRLANARRNMGWWGELTTDAVPELYPAIFGKIGDYMHDRQLGTGGSLKLPTLQQYADATHGSDDVTLSKWLMANPDAIKFLYNTNLPDEYKTQLDDTAVDRLRMLLLSTSGSDISANAPLDAEYIRNHMLNNLDLLTNYDPNNPSAPYSKGLNDELTRLNKSYHDYRINSAKPGYNNYRQDALQQYQEVFGKF